MVETWEIEWNSSMIEHGVDMGTMEFIFAKAGLLAMSTMSCSTKATTLGSLSSRPSRSATTLTPTLSQASRTTTTVLHATGQRPLNNSWEQALILQERLTGV